MTFVLEKICSSSKIHDALLKSNEIGAVFRPPLGHSNHQVSGVSLLKRANGIVSLSNTLEGWMSRDILWIRRACQGAELGGEDMSCRSTGVGCELEIT